MNKKNKCPLCGSDDIQKLSYTGDEMLGCNGCREILFYSELVKRATKKTRKQYKIMNGIED